MFGTKKPSGSRSWNVSTHVIGMVATEKELSWNKFLKKIDKGNRVHCLETMSTRQRNGNEFFNLGEWLENAWARGERWLKWLKGEPGEKGETGLSFEWAEIKGDVLFLILEGWKKIEVWNVVWPQWIPGEKGNSGKPGIQWNPWPQWVPGEKWEPGKDAKTISIDLAINGGKKKNLEVTI